jgi:hypothetical protein
MTAAISSIVSPKGVYFAAALTFVLFLWTMHSPPSLSVLVNYLALLAAPWLLGVGYGMPRQKRWPAYAGFMAGLVLWYLWAKVDYYDHRWTDKDGFTFIDSTYRGEYRPFYRYMWKSDDERNDLFRTEGGFSPSFKRHGPWDTFQTGAGPELHQWFWYGEEITEGEWHLRNR